MGGRRGRPWGVGPGRCGGPRARAGAVRRGLSGPAPALWADDPVWGRLAPMNLAMDARDRLACWSALSCGPAPCGAAHCLCAGETEIVHFHGDNEADVHLTRPLLARLGPALRRSTALRLCPATGWVTVRLETGSDIDRWPPWSARPSRPAARTPATTARRRRPLLPPPEAVTRGPGADRVGHGGYAPFCPRPSVFAPALRRPGPPPAAVQLPRRGDRRGDRRGARAEPSGPRPGHRVAAVRTADRGEPWRTTRCGAAGGAAPGCASGCGSRS